MSIREALEVKRPSEFYSEHDPEHIRVVHDPSGTLVALSWRYPSVDQGLYMMAKRRGGVWNREIYGWTFPAPGVAEALLKTIAKRNPDWPVIGDPSSRPLTGKLVHRLPALPNGLHACLIPSPLPYGIKIPSTRRMFKLSGSGKREIGLLIDEEAAISAAITSMVKLGALCENKPSTKWPLTASKERLKVTTAGWTVTVKFNLSNLLHLLSMPAQNGYLDGTLHTTRKRWGAIEKILHDVGLDWEGDDPADEPTLPTAFDASKVTGWNTPTPSGYLLHAYQKEGAEFCARRGMRALVGDEMGIGKTAQAIAAAEATSSQRVIVFCPANARYVWDREIREWSGRGEIQHITSSLDLLDTSARWHIITYDLIATRAESWRLNDAQELAAFSAACPDLVKNIEKSKPNQFPQKVTIDKVVTNVPQFADKKRIAAWEKVMRRLRAELLEQILAIGPVLVVLDEAHRVKNREAKRTKAIQQITDGDTRVLLLTGTPLRNNEHEAAVLLSLLDKDTCAALSRGHSYTIEDVKDYLDYFMIRRTKLEVLPELPEKTRQRIDISQLDPRALSAYRRALENALESYDLARAHGKSEAEAKQAMQGGIERARTELGLAKVLGGEVADLVVDVVENKQCCVVFCAHHAVSDQLKAQLVKEGLRVAIVDGRTAQKDRAEIVKNFQSGGLDVFIGGIHAAGESITLTRADTVVFTELDWVPASLLQAEDRVHRVGQKGNCQIVQLIARMPDEDNLDEMMIDLIGAKLARIGQVLDEDQSNIIAKNIQTQIRDRLLGISLAAPVAMQFPFAVPSKVPPKTLEHSETSDNDKTPTPERAEGQDAIHETEVVKRKRGRPKVYKDNAPPSATERSKQSIKALAASGGKRIMLRLTPDAYDALRKIMDLTGVQQETAAINLALMARRDELSRGTDS
jgi:superfamily II DNA or RNA helicase